MIEASSQLRCVLNNLVCSQDLEVSISLLLVVSAFLLGSKLCIALSLPETPRALGTIPKTLVQRTNRPNVLVFLQVSSNSQRLVHL